MGIFEGFSGICSPLSSSLLSSSLLSSSLLCSSLLFSHSSQAAGGSLPTGRSWGGLEALLSPLSLRRPRRKTPPRLLFHTITHLNSTQLHSTSLHSTQLNSTHFWTLPSLHFGASWAPISAPKRLKMGSGRLLTPHFFKIVIVHETSAGVVSGAFLGPQDGAKIDPRSPQDGLKSILEAIVF